MSWPRDAITWTPSQSSEGDSQTSTASSERASHSENELFSSPSQDPVDCEDREDLPLESTNSPDYSPDDRPLGRTSAMTPQPLASESLFSDSPPVPLDSSLTPPEMSQDSGSGTDSSQERSSLETQMSQDSEESDWSESSEDSDSDRSLNSQDMQENLEGLRRPWINPVPVTREKAREFIDSRNRWKNRRRQDKASAKARLQKGYQGTRGASDDSQASRTRRGRPTANEVLSRLRSRRGGALTLGGSGPSLACYESKQAEDTAVEPLSIPIRQRGWVILPLKSPATIEVAAPEEDHPETRSVSTMVEEGESTAGPSGDQAEDDLSWLAEFMRPKRRRLSDEQLREINENWNKVYEVTDAPAPNPNLDPDSVALSIKLSLKEVLEDTEYILKERIPGLLRIIERKERLDSFHENVAEDLTAVYKFVETKALVQIEAMKKNCASLSELDENPTVSEASLSALNDLHKAASDAAAELENLRSDKAHSAIEQSLLSSHVELYQMLLQELDEQSIREEAELVKYEHFCNELKEKVADAIRNRDALKEAPELQTELKSALETKDKIQAELELVQAQIREQQEVISFPDILTVKRFMKALPGATAALAAAKGISFDPEAAQTEDEDSAGVLNFGETIQALIDTLEKISRKSVATQTVLELRHVVELESYLESHLESGYSSQMVESLSSQQTTQGSQSLSKEDTTTDSGPATQGSFVDQ